MTTDLFFLVMIIFVESNFDALYYGISRSDWRMQYDIPSPFGDHRECLVSTVWTVDLDRDILTVQKKNLNLRVPLDRLRGGRIFISDMEPFEPPPLQTFNLSRNFPQPTWDPKLVGTQRQIMFVGKMLEDFSHQWRHVLRSRYNDATFRRLACGILRIVSLDFTVKEVGSRPGGGVLVALENMPRWEPFPKRIIHLGSVSVVLCQHATHALPTLGEDLEQRRARYQLYSPPPPHDRVCQTITYLILSVREVFLYRVCTCNKHSPMYTKPEPLFNGTDKPSPRALGYLFMAAPAQRQSSTLHNLPVEVQDSILGKISRGKVESARVGCMLSLGTPFKWERDNGGGRGGMIQLQTVLTTKPYDVSVESQIWFDGFPSGLAYK